VRPGFPAYLEFPACLGFQAGKSRNCDASAGSGNSIRQERPDYDGRIGLDDMPVEMTGGIGLRTFEGSVFTGGLQPFGLEQMPLGMLNGRGVVDMDVRSVR
jgi:hypothetical protein